MLWLVVVAWLLSSHVFWRDEVRAFTLALSGSNLVEMLSNIQGEGHPALWYLMLRCAHGIIPVREVLPAIGAMVGLAAMGLLTFLSPFRTLTIGLIVFSLYGAFEYVVVSRNYGVAALIMFVIAALYDRIRDTLWFGVLIALLANANVPSCLLAGCLMLFRFIELMLDRSRVPSRDWLVFAGNAAIATFGAWLCFITVYPPVNDGAVSTNLATLTVASFGRALIDPTFGVAKIGLPPILSNLLLVVSCFSLIHRPAALAASVAGFLMLKLFFYFIYPPSYRHEVQQLVFLLALHWMVVRGAGGKWPNWRPTRLAPTAGAWALMLVLFSHSVLLVYPVRSAILHVPYSRSAEAAGILQRPGFEGAIVMADPDTMLEALPYYVDNPMWLLRERRFGKVARLVSNSRSEMSLDDVLADVRRLHQTTGRPIVYFSNLELERAKPGRYQSMFHNGTVVTREGRARFRASTRLIARLRPSLSDESYDVYRYPR